MMRGRKIKSELADNGAISGTLFLEVDRTKYFLHSWVQLYGEILSLDWIGPSSWRQERDWLMSCWTRKVIGSREIRTLDDWFKLNRHTPSINLFRHFQKNCWQRIVKIMLQRVVNATGQSCRSIGQAIDRIGAGIEGSLSYTEHCTSFEWIYLTFYPSSHRVWSIRSKSIHEMREI